MRPSRTLSLALSPAVRRNSGATAKLTTPGAACASAFRWVAALVPGIAGTSRRMTDHTHYTRRRA